MDAITAAQDERLAALRRLLDRPIAGSRAPKQRMSANARVGLVAALLLLRRASWANVEHCSHRTCGSMIAGHLIGKSGSRSAEETFGTRFDQRPARPARLFRSSP